MADGAKNISAWPEEKSYRYDSAQHQNCASCHEHWSYPGKGDAGNRQHQDSQEHERKPARPVFPSRPPLAGFVECAQAPQDEHDAEDQPHSAVPVHQNTSTQSQPCDQRAEQDENQFDRGAQHPLWREHSLAFAFAQAMRSIRSLLRVTGVRGLSLESRGTFEILLATSCPSTTSPKIVCRLSSQGVAATVMKNWLPFVFGPALAIERNPAFEWFSEGWNSSANLYPGPPMPLLCGHPPWIMNCGITR